MDFISNQEPQNRAMLESIGKESIEAFFKAIPEKIRLKAPEKDDGISEYEGIRLMEQLASKNTYASFKNYLGAGAYEHHVPAIVNAICSKSEFLTSYTPYQAEASQGMLQTIFEFQSAICALTGLDVSNASLYDGASAAAEAVLMALRLRKDRNKVLIAETLHPHYLGVVKQYLESHPVEVVLIPFLSDGRIDQEKLFKELDGSVAAVLLQYPNFLGTLDDIKPIAKKAKEADALTILSANPMVYGLYHSAEELGIDIAVGDCQPFGLPLQFGGPYVGYMACRQEFIRQLPGRIVGETVDSQGRRGFVLTLQAREQHIRREKATSNICTNQSLGALACLVGMLWYGKKGIHDIALTNFQRASYLKKRLEEALRFKPFSQAPFFNEFVVRFPLEIGIVQSHFRDKGIEPGLDLQPFYPALKNCLLIAVTEVKSKSDLDEYVRVAREITEKQ